MLNSGVESSSFSSPARTFRYYFFVGCLTYTSSISSLQISSDHKLVHQRFFFCATVCWTEEELLMNYKKSLLSCKWFPTSKQYPRYYPRPYWPFISKVHSDKGIGFQCLQYCWPFISKVHSDIGIGFQCWQYYCWPFNG